MTTDPSERRQHARYPVQRLVKLRLPGSGRFWNARTCNMSAGGAMITLDYPARLQSDDTLQIAIPRHDGQAVIHNDQLFDAQVIRNLGHDGVQHVAVQFEPAAVLRQAG